MLTGQIDSPTGSFIPQAGKTATGLDRNEGEMTLQIRFRRPVAYWQQLLYGCWLTIVLATLAIAMGSSLASSRALAKQSRIGAINFIATSYVELIRNTPFSGSSLFSYFGLPALGVACSPGAPRSWRSASLRRLRSGGHSGGYDGIARVNTAGAALASSPFRSFVTSS